MTDYSQQYFTIESLEDGNVITLTIGANVPSTALESFSYSTDGGTTWTTTNNVSSTLQTININLDKGHTALCKGIGSRTAGGYQGNNAYYSIFSSTKTFIVYGNISSLILGDNYSTNITSPNINNLFRRLFYQCTTIISAENLVLPYVLVNGTAQYAEMFGHCTSLTKAPKLTSENLTQQCYYYMLDDTAVQEVICLATYISNSNAITNWLRNTPASGTFYKHPSMTSWPSGASGIPSSWTISDYYDDYSQQYFTVQSQEDNNTITFTIGSGVTTAMFSYIAYSTDDGTNWTTLTNNGSSEQTLSVTLNNGAKAIWKGIGERTGVVDNVIADRCTIMGSKTFIVYGNITSLLKGDNFYNNYSMSQAGTYVGLFYKDASNDANVVDASKLVLPATTLTESCYYEMFRHCQKLLYAPELPATSLSSAAYRGMFRDCILLSKCPDLPATTLGNWCYTHMFYNCKAITKAAMLPVSTLSSNAYYQMFLGCTSLSEVICLATDISATNSTYQWLRNVAASGTFYKHPSMTGWSTGENGIPSGWTTKDYMMLTINGKVPAAVKFVQNGVTHDLDYLKFGNNLVWQKTT